MEIGYLDAMIIIIYLLVVALLGSFSGGKQKTLKDYFMGGKDVPWWAVSFSIVAAETSSLTFISIPGLAYLTNLNFLQIYSWPEVEPPTEGSVRLPVVPLL